MAEGEREEVRFLAWPAEPTDKAAAGGEGKTVQCRGLPNT